MTTISFLGAARTVTGSRFLIMHNDLKILVDCGLFQGLKDLRRRNWEPFLVPAHEIDYIILTHAHIDHSGFIPRMVRQGFHGKIITTEITRELVTYCCGTADTCRRKKPVTQTGWVFPSTNPPSLFTK